MQQQTNNLTEQEIMNDALSSEKQIISAYGTFLAESTCENLRSEMSKIINDKQQIQFEIFDTMKQKGWYKIGRASCRERV